MNFTTIFNLNDEAWGLQSIHKTVVIKQNQDPGGLYHQTLVGLQEWRVAPTHGFRVAAVQINKHIDETLVGTRIEYLCRETTPWGTHHYDQWFPERDLFRSREEAEAEVERRTWEEENK